MTAWQKGACTRTEPSSINLELKDAHVQIVRAGCAVEWEDEAGVVHRYESIGRAEAQALAVAGGWEYHFQPENGPRLVWLVEPMADGALLSLRVINATPRPIRMRTLEPFVLNFRHGSRFTINGALNQAWLYGETCQCGDQAPVHLWSELYHYHVFQAEGLCCLYRPDQGAAGFAFTTQAHLFTKFRLEFNGREPLLFSASSMAEERLLASGATMAAESLRVVLGAAPQPVIEACAVQTAAAMRVPAVRPAPTGWSTWDYYFGDISETCVLENVRFLAEQRDRFPVEVIQLDAGYCAFGAGWLNWKQDTFPHGPAWLVREIRRHGFKAGLWLVLFYMHADQPETRAHPEWLVQDQDGKPLKTDALGGGYVLDGTHPGAQSYLRGLGRAFTEELGFEYIKIDGASFIGAIAGRRHDPNASTCRAYRLGIEAFRAGMAPGTFFLGAVLGPSIGVVDATRIGEDVGARWDWSKTNVHLGERDRYHGSGNVSRCIRSIMNCHYMNGRYWINDGDYLVVREDRSELTLDEARTWATVTGLYGGSLILSDRMTTLPPERLAILEKILPRYPGMFRLLDAYLKPTAETGVMELTAGGRTGWVAALFNYASSPAVKRLDLKALAVAPADGWHAFGFWSQKYYGVVREVAEVSLAPHACEVLALRPVAPTPQLIGTDLHITQGGLELSSENWDPARATLKLALKAPGRKSGRLTVACPAAWRFVRAAGAAVQNAAAVDPLVTVDVAYDRQAEIELNFRA